MENGSNGFAYTIKCQVFLDGIFIPSYGISSISGSGTPYGNALKPGVHYHFSQHRVEYKNGF